MLQGRELSKIVGVVIEGHTDAKGDEDGNVTYSRKRAGVIRDYLISKGISESLAISYQWPVYCFASKFCIGVKEGHVPRERPACVWSTR